MRLRGAGKDGAPSRQPTAVRDAFHELEDLIGTEMVGRRWPQFAWFVADALVLARTLRALCVSPHNLFGHSLDIVSLTLRSRAAALSFPNHPNDLGRAPAAR